MAQTFQLAAQTDWADLAEGEVRTIPLLKYDNGVRVCMLVSRRGTWPKHMEDSAELYTVLKGEVILITDREQHVKAGEAILLAPGEPHGARVEDGGRLDQRGFRVTERHRDARRRIFADSPTTQWSGRSTAHALRSSVALQLWAAVHRER
jgi:quercetin dioxygenase-like cupin family protein